MDLTQGTTSNATLEIGDNGMGITLSGAFPLWEDDEKFEDLISLLRKEARDGAQGAQGGVGIKKIAPRGGYFLNRSEWVPVQERARTRTSSYFL